MAFADDYNTVPERLKEFFEKYPTGCFQRVGPVEMFEVEGVHYLAFTAAAFRDPADPCPGYGTAWERVPGLTKFTQNSELQNAETSAWGRAIIAVGAADAKKGIASREDVASRQAEQDYYQSPEYAEQQRIPGLRSAVAASLAKLKATQPETTEDLALWFKEQDLPRPERMSVEQCERVIDHLMTLPGPSSTDGSDGTPTEGKA